MNFALQFVSAAGKEMLGWSWLKKSLFTAAALGCLTSSFLFLTPIGDSIRLKLAETVITTQHRDWAWIFVGAKKRDEMVQAMQDQTDVWGTGGIDIKRIKYQPNRPMDSLVKVEDIKGKYWVGKKMYVYDPRSLRVVVPNKQGEGERITSMVERTGAVAGINAGGFDDPDGLGNGFAPIGFIISGGEMLYTDTDGKTPQHVVGVTDEGTLIVGKYTFTELQKLHVMEAVSFYPRIIADGKPLITKGDGGWGRAPRTAIGQKEDGTIIIAVIDGRQTHSVGATLKEVQDMFIADGVVNAGFLDGGASSELVMKDQGLVTKPSSRYGERRLPSAFLVFNDPNSYKPDHIWDGLTHIDPGGAYDHPEYQAELAAKRARDRQVGRSPAPTVSASEKPNASPDGGSQSSTANPSTKPSVRPGATPGRPPARPTPSPASGKPPAQSSKPPVSAKPHVSPSLPAILPKPTTAPQPTSEPNPSP